MSVRTKSSFFFRTALGDQFLGGEQSLVTGICSKYSVEGIQEAWPLDQDPMFLRRV